MLIGENSEEAILKKFNGIFDGFDYTIKGLYIKKNETTDIGTGLFGYVGEDGEVKDLKIADSYIWGYNETGAFVGRNRGKIINCTNEAIVVGDNNLTGGIAGRTMNLIENCTNNSNIKGVGSQIGGIVSNCDFGSDVIVRNCINNGKIEGQQEYTGGIVGGAWNTNGNSKVTIINCKNYGEIVNESEVNGVAGIVGAVAKNNVITNCENKGEITGYQYVGGIVGRNLGSIESCKNYGKINTNYSRGGGIAGFNSGSKISKCSNYGYIYMSESGYYGIGGIAGANGHTTNKSTIELCYNEGEVYNCASGGKQSGGIVGNLSAGEPYTPGLIEVVNCYNKGYIHGVNCVGGIAGYANNAIIKNCYSIRKSFWR